MESTQITPITTSNFAALRELNPFFTPEQASLIFVLQELLLKNERENRLDDAADNCAGIISIVQNLCVGKKPLATSAPTSLDSNLPPAEFTSDAVEVPTRQPAMPSKSSLKSLKTKCLAFLQALHGFFLQKINKLVLAEASYQFTLKAIKQLEAEDTALEVKVLNNLCILYRDSGKEHQSSLLLTRLTKTCSK